MSRLILSRHGESEFNAKSLWTGIWDAPLTAKGRQQAVQMGEALADVHLDAGYSSALVRSKDTLKLIMTTNHWSFPVKPVPEFNERDYGELTGMNKWDVEEKYGEDQFTRWRRGWDEPVPGGETLKDVYNRAVPYFTKAILPQLTSGKSVIITAHGNSLRTLIKHLDGINDTNVENLEMIFGEIVLYEFGKDGHTHAKEIRQIDTTSTPA